MPRTNRTDMERFLAKMTRAANGCWIWTGASRGVGYGAIMLHGRVIDAHRASWLLHRGPIPEGHVVMHTCDVRSCVNPDHLRTGTYQENWQDGVAKGRLTVRKVPVLNPLTDEQIAQIVDRYERCLSVKTLMVEFQTPRTSLARILLKHSAVFRAEHETRKRSRTVAEPQHGTVKRGSASH